GRTGRRRGADPTPRSRRRSPPRRRRRRSSSAGRSPSSGARTSSRSPTGSTSSPRSRRRRGWDRSSTRARARSATRCRSRAAQAADQPDMAGKVAVVTEGSDGAQHVGRFGWKAQHALLVDFAADAYNNEMGVTSDLAPLENQPNAPPTATAVKDVGDEDVDKF